MTSELIDDHVLKCLQITRNDLKQHAGWEEAADGSFDLSWLEVIVFGVPGVGNPQNALDRKLSRACSVCF